MNLWQRNAGDTEAARRRQAFETLWGKLLRSELPHFVVADAARDEAILAFVRALGEKATCLYSGDARIRLANYAPYLFRIEMDCMVTRQFLADGWGQSWYILISSQSPLEDIAWQLRKALVVRTDEGKDFYFRFYDPRVLRSYLPMCSQDDADKLMSKAIATLFCETHDATGILHCKANPAGILNAIGGRWRDYQLVQLSLTEERTYG